MPAPQKMTGKLVDAVYVDTDKEVALLLETPNGRCQARVHRDEIATFGDRDEAEISKEMDKYVDILKHKCLGKTVTVISDTDLDNKLKEGYPIRY